MTRDKERLPRERNNNSRRLRGETTYFNQVPTDYPKDGHYIYAVDGIRFDESYKNGKLEGDRTLVDDTTGEVLCEAHFKNGNLDGEFVKYDYDGRITELSEYENGKLDGKRITREYGSNDEITTTTAWYKNGVLHGFYKKELVTAKDFEDFDPLRDDLDDLGEIIEKKYYRDGNELDYKSLKTRKQPQNMEQPKNTISQESPLNIPQERDSY